MLYERRATLSTTEDNILDNFEVWACSSLVFCIFGSEAFWFCWFLVSQCQNIHTEASPHPDYPHFVFLLPDPLLVTCRVAQSLALARATWERPKLGSSPGLNSAFSIEPRTRADLFPHFEAATFPHFGPARYPHFGPANVSTLWPGNDSTLWAANVSTLWAGSVSTLWARLIVTLWGEQWDFMVFV